MSQASQTESSYVRGNTSKRNRCRSWFFTFNNYTNESIDRLIKQFIILKIIYVFQEEKGASGTKHLQGVIKSDNQISFTTLKDIEPKCHWEKTKHWEKAIEYCSKSNTRNGKFYSNFMEDPEIKNKKDKFYKFCLKKWKCENHKDLIEKLYIDLANTKIENCPEWILEEPPQAAEFLLQYLDTL